MALSEFELIRRYFNARDPRRNDVAVDIGDDGAVLDVPAGEQLVVAMDTMIAGVHFPVDTMPDAIGHKALAVNLSDLAAMGAAPAWMTLALTLPEIDEPWLESFCDGLFRLAGKYDVQLVGGDTTRGALSVTIQAHGLVPRGAALRRAGAAAGDLIYVTGTIGDAGLGLHCRQYPEDHSFDGDRSRLGRRLDYPEPRVAEGLMLRGLATAAIDISDGLAADLGHILEASGVGATVELARVPVSASVAAHARRVGAPGFALTAGDDYELCFTVPAARRAELEQRLAKASCGCRCIGLIEARPGLRVVLPGGGSLDPGPGGYRHFG